MTSANSVPRRRLLVAGPLVLALAGCSASPRSPATEGPEPGEEVPDVPGEEPSREAEGASESTPGGDDAASAGLGDSPARMDVPRIETSGDLIELGLTSENTLEVPEDPSRMGWFTGGGRPGGPGPTIIAGHVDSDDGPAVFFRLSELVPGDEAVVLTEDGRRVVYQVDRLEEHAKDDFPIESIFGATREDSLRLITCTGPWIDREASYRDNCVVFATAVSA